MPAEKPFGAPVDAPSDIALSMAMMDRPPTGTDLHTVTSQSLAARYCPRRAHNTPKLRLLQGRRFRALSLWTLPLGRGRAPANFETCAGPGRRYRDYVNTMPVTVSHILSYNCLSIHSSPALHHIRCFGVCVNLQTRRALQDGADIARSRPYQKRATGCHCSGATLAEC